MRSSRPPRKSWLVHPATWGAGAILVVGLAGALVIRQAGQKPGRLGMLQNSLEPSPSRPWTNIDGKFWQLASPPGEPPSETDEREGNRKSCPEGMVHVTGDYLLDPSGNDGNGAVERLQDDVCTKWIDREFPARCATFDRERWLAVSRELPRKPMHFCIDRFEYPNRRGENPYIVVSYREAQALCASGGRRLCTESEWTFACEGEEGQPYPYGYGRDPDACVFDRSWRAWNEGVFGRRDSEVLRGELDRLWQGEASGARPGCKSPFGVYDLTGNVDEWTRSVRKEGLPSILKGGYWGPVRARCRPSTRAHGETFVAYQQGVRCCADDGPNGVDGGTLGDGGGAGATTGGTAPGAAATEGEADGGPRGPGPVASPGSPGSPGSQGSPPADEPDDELTPPSRRPGIACAVPLRADAGEGSRRLWVVALALALALARRRPRRSRAFGARRGAAGGRRIAGRIVGRAGRSAGRS